MTGSVVVIDYNPEWPAQFERLRRQLMLAMQGIEISIEHVGSTSVSGLAAKPILDIDIVAQSRLQVADAIARLEAIGYKHRGNLGIEDRDAFWAPVVLTQPPFAPHHLYVCLAGSLGLQNHLAVRDYLRSSPAAVETYSTLKKQLAKDFPNDIDSYIAGKTDFILKILRQANFSTESISSVESVNRSPRYDA